MVDVDRCVVCSEAHSSCTFAGDASLPTAVLRSPDWIFLCSVAVKKQKHSAGFGFSYHFGYLFCSSGKPSDSTHSIADLQIRRTFLCPPLSCPQSCVHQTGTLSSLYLRESKSIERASVLVIISANAFAHREFRPSNSTIWSADRQIR